MKAIIYLVLVFVLVGTLIEPGHTQGNSPCAQFCHDTFPTTAGQCTSQAARGYGPCYECGPAQPVGPIHIDACLQGTSGAKCCTAQAPTCMGGNCVGACPNDTPLHYYSGLPQCLPMDICVNSPAECCQLCRSTHFTASNGPGCEGHPCDAYWVGISPAPCNFDCELLGFQGSQCPTFHDTGPGSFISYCLSSL